MTEKITAAIIGGSGYAGGELVRLLLMHPHIELTQVTSERMAGKFVKASHPNLRGVTDLKFIASEKLQPVDVLFMALPHGVSMEKLPQVRELAKVVIDLSSDFRLSNPDDYVTWYSHEHADLDALGNFVYGMPELHREQIKTADWIASPGCMSTTSILGLWPLFQAGVVDMDQPVIIEAKTGSSGSGGSPNLASHHAERSGVIRSFKPTGHRHTAEIMQELTFDGAVPRINFSATSIEAVRGILSTSHVFLQDDLDDKALRKIYRDAFKDEPFMRLVKENVGVHRYPEPKLLSGSNWCDVGFERDEHSKRVVVMAATDNLMKGASGQAVQSMNVRMGWNERTGLEFPGLHPI